MERKSLRAEADVAHDLAQAIAREKAAVENTRDVLEAESKEVENRRAALDELEQMGRRELDEGKGELKVAAEALEREKEVLKAARKVRSIASEHLLASQRVPLQERSGAYENRCCCLQILIAICFGRARTAVVSTLHVDPPLASSFALEFDPLVQIIDGEYCDQFDISVVRGRSAESRDGTETFSGRLGAREGRASAGKGRPG